MSAAYSKNQNCFSPTEMMAEAEKFALSKAKTSGMILGLSVMAGALIGLAFLFYITVTTGSASAGWGLSRLAGGVAFSMGLILIVICGGELSTSSVLSSISWANREISFGKCSLSGSRCTSVTLSVPFSTAFGDSGWPLPA